MFQVHVLTKVMVIGCRNPQINGLMQSRVSSINTGVFVKIPGCQRGDHDGINMATSFV